MLKPGLYDKPIDRALAEALEAIDPTLTTIEDLDPAAAPDALARVVSDRVRAVLSSVGGRPDECRAKQLGMVNAVLALLGELGERGASDDGDALAPPARRLLSIASAPIGLGGPLDLPRPKIALSSSDLLVNGPHDLSLGSEIRSELGSADRVDLLCSFLKWSGFRVLEDELREFLARRPGGLRVLTTAYMGATERRALDELAKLGADVRVSYDTERTRLHAKAWLFHRETGYSTGYVGSSNLSAAAMLDGLEWNVRLSRVDNRAILDKFLACFEQYWDDADFRPYDPETDARTYDDAVRRQVQAQTRFLTAIDIHPRPHQQQILDALAAEREAGHVRNLVVAATGTGKTVVAALDYQRLVERLGRASLLFVAHRTEILEQSRTMFQVALSNGSFGEMLAKGERPRAGEHVFASIQSLTAERLAELDPHAYDVVIVDEFHHAAAPTYDRLLEHLRPKFLLGLTATPERADGRPILHHFDDRIAAELRLWEALDQELLSPFQYFGLAGPDLRSVPWSGGKYVTSAVREVYTADDVFLIRVLRELRSKVADPFAMRALGFCVDVAHARFMADRFEKAGIASRVIVGATGRAEREAALGDLRDGRAQIVFSVDVLSEGVDLPTVDTILFLRPTESATVFLQQLGRGLRRARNKECCTVLDFIGSANRSFRFDQRFRALLGGTRRTIIEQIEQDFPRLPSGCAIRLDRASQAAVLENIKASIGAGRSGLVEDLKALGDVGLDRFLAHTELELEDVYAKDASFTELRRRAGFAVEDPSPEGKVYERAFARMLHLDDAYRLSALRTMVEGDRPPVADDADPAQRFLFILLGSARHSYARIAECFEGLWARPDLLAELRALLRILEDRRRNLVVSLPELPLFVHATYTRDEVMAGVDARSSKGGVKRIQAGVYEAKWLATELLFVTLEKLEKDYSPTTMYNDYPMSARRFHWESQSTAHPRTGAGQRYLTVTPNGERSALLFVRQHKRDSRGLTAPYLNLGRVSYAKHEGERPMRIEWILEHPIPPGTFQKIKVAAG